MKLRVKPSLHFCVVEGRTIFMDEKSSRYFCLPVAIDESFQRSVSVEGFLDVPDNASLAELTNLDLIEPLRGPVIVPRQVICEPSKDFGKVSIINPKLSELIGTVFIRLCSQIGVGFRDIQRIRADLDRERLKFRNRPRARPDSSLQAILRAFEQSDIIFGRSDRCLPRSVALVRRSFRAGFNPRLIIGVRVNPFAAHCWVQHDDMIIGDSLDIVRIYTPICVL